MLGLAWLTQDVLGSTITLAAGLAATASGTLSITVAAGRVLQLASADATSVADGVLPPDTTQVMQQGWVGASSLLLSTAGLTAGQSRWALVEAGFSQADAIAPNDPNNGVLPFFNINNVFSPLIGPGGNGQSQPTVRQGLAVVKIVYGNAATTGSEVPPQPDAGYVPLYLIDLAYGQTVVNQGQVLVAGPSVGAGVPNNYPQAPFLAGLLASHHGGIPGQAPKINLANEVTGQLDYVNIKPVRHQLSAGLNLYVNASTGSDSNDGLTSGTAFATLTKAWRYVQTTLDLNGYSVTIHVADGTYAGILAFGSVVGAISGAGSVVFLGNTSSPSSVIISATNASGVAAGFGAAFTVRGMKVTATGTGSGQGYGITTSTGASVNFSSFEFGSCAVAHKGATNEGSIVIEAGGVYSITGNAPIHDVANTLGIIYMAGAGVTLVGVPAFSTAFAVSQDNAMLEMSSITYTGIATGPRYLANLGGGINTSGGGSSYLPGNSSGTATSPGFYA